jgi:hypothetical protein
MLEPTFGDCPPALCRLLGLVLHSCVNETLATACLTEGLEAAVSPTARAATHELEELVLPGFDHVGVDTRAGRDWFARNCVG